MLKNMLLRARKMAVKLLFWHQHLLQASELVIPKLSYQRKAELGHGL